MINFKELYANPIACLKIFTILFSALVLLSACSNGGGSGGSEPDPVPAEDETFTLGGRVQGISGVATITNGDIEFTLTRPGEFVFTEEFSGGSAYDVRIKSLPDGQVCEVRNSVGTFAQDVTDLVVDCADMVSVELAIDVPTNYSLDELRILSNFEALGGEGESPLDTETPSLLVFQNTFISLINADGETLFLSYILDTNQNRITVDALTTAISLLMLEPTLFLAARDRANSVATSFDYNVFIDALADSVSGESEAVPTSQPVVDAVAQLANTIDLHINAGESLQALSEEVLDALADAVIETANFLVSDISLSASSNIASTKPIVNGQTLQKVFAGGDAGEVGARIDYVQGQESDLITITAKNISGRYLVLESQEFGQDSLAPQIQAASDENTCLTNDCIVYELASGLGSQERIALNIAGPGRQGDIADDNVDGIVSASAFTGVNQYFLPSVNPMLGLNNPFRFNLANCFEPSTLEGLATNTASAFAGANNVLSKRYYHVFTEMTQSTREDFLSTAIGPQLPILELFDCDKFGIGVFIESNKFLAIENTENLLGIANLVYSALGDVIETDLLSLDGLSFLSDSINGSQAQYTWEISNLLALTISADRVFVLENTDVSFTGSCSNPANSEAVDCSIQWDFGDGNSAEGASVVNNFGLLGDYTVTATAIDADGAQASETLMIDVDEPLPRIRISQLNGEALEDPAHDYGEVSVGETATVDVNIHNDGFLDLVIENFGSDNSQYLIDPNFASLIGPGAASQVSIEFTPTVLESSQANIRFDSNDPQNPRVEFRVSGTGVVSADGNYWTVAREDETQVFLVNRTVFVPDIENQLFEIRGFASENTDFPQVSISLVEFDRRGNGDYQLDRTCLGAFIETSLVEDQFCTNFRTAVGIASVSDTPLANQKRLTFEFTAVPRDCDPDSQVCETITVNGDMFFETTINN